MVVKQRREREKQEMQRSILEAAREIAMQEGWPAVTIRKVADYVEYSPAGIYEYFDSKEAILVALKGEGFQTMLEKLQTAWAADASPSAKIMAGVLAQFDFALDHPELFQVMYGIGGIRCGMTDTPIERREVFIAVRETVGALLQQAGAKVESVDDTMQIIQATVVGIVTLTMNDRITGGKPRGRQLLQQAVYDYLTAWGATNTAAQADAF